MRSFLIILLFSLTSCHFETEIQNELSRAKENLQESPEIALNILEHIDPTTLKKKRVRAEYALLYSMALDKNYIFVDSDSLIRIARDFYRRSNDLQSKYLSKFYYGLILQNRKEYAEALINHLEAENDCLQLGDPYLLGLLYNEISDIYKTQSDYANSLKYARKSFENYRSSNRKHHTAYALANMGDAQAEFGLQDSAKICFLSSLHIAESLCDTPMIRFTYGRLALAHIDNNEPQKAIEALWKIRKELQVDLDSWENSVMASAYRKSRKLDSALYYLRQAEQTFTDSRAKAHFDFTAAAIHLETGAYRKAAEEYRHSAHIQDSLCRSVLRQSYANLHRDYIEERQRATMNTLQSTRQKLLLAIALAVVFISFIVYIAYINWRKRQQTKTLYIAAIDEIRQTNQLLSLKLDAQQKANTKELRRLLKDRFSVVNELAATYYERQGTNEQKAIFNKVKAMLDSYASNEDGKQEIEEAVNACYDNVMVKIRQELPSLKESELNLLRYVYAGFSLRVISVFTGDSINYTAVKKSRLKAKIAESDAPSKEVFTSLMS